MGSIDKGTRNTEAIVKLAQTREKLKDIGKRGRLSIHSALNALSAETKEAMS